MAVTLDSSNSKITNLDWLNAGMGATIPLKIGGKDYIYFPESYYKSGLVTQPYAYGGTENFIYSPAFLQEGIEQKFIPVTLGNDLYDQINNRQPIKEISIQRVENPDKGYLIAANDFKSAMQNTSAPEMVTGQGPGAFVQMPLSGLKEKPTGLVMRNGQKSYASASGLSYTDASGQFYNYNPPSGGGGGLFGGGGFLGLGDLAPVAMAFIVPQLGAVFAESLVAEGLVSAASASVVGNALASVTVQTAAGVEFEEALKNASINAAVQTGSSNVMTEITKAGTDPKIAAAIVSTGGSMASSALRGGSESDILNAGIAGLTSSGVTSATDDRVLGAAAGGAVTGGAAGAAISAAGALGSEAAKKDTTTTTPTKVSEVDTSFQPTLDVGNVAEIAAQTADANGLTGAAKLQYILQQAGAGYPESQQAFLAAAPLVLPAGEALSAAIGIVGPALIGTLGAAGLYDLLNRYGVYDQFNEAWKNATGSDFTPKSKATEFPPSPAGGGRGYVNPPGVTPGKPGTVKPTVPGTETPGTVQTGPGGTTTPGTVLTPSGTTTTPGDVVGIDTTTGFVPPGLPPGITTPAPTGGEVAAPEGGAGDETVVAGRRTTEVTDPTLVATGQPAGGPPTETPPIFLTPDQIQKYIGGEQIDVGTTPVTADVQRVAEVLNVDTQTALALKQANSQLFDYINGGGDPVFKAADPETMRSTDLINVSRPGADDNIVIQRNEPLTFTDTVAKPSTEIVAAQPKEGFVARVDETAKTALIIYPDGDFDIVNLPKDEPVTPNTSVRIDPKTQTIIKTEPKITSVDIAKPVITEKPVDITKPIVDETGFKPPIDSSTFPPPPPPPPPPVLPEEDERRPPPPPPTPSEPPPPPPPPEITITPPKEPIVPKTPPTEPSEPRRPEEPKRREDPTERQDPFLTTFVSRKTTPLSRILGQESYPAVTTGLTAYRPAGEIESEETGKKRQDVWNEASLRLKDALGL